MKRGNAIYKAKDATALMRERYPKLKTFTLLRDIIERPDCTPEEKIVYAVVCSISHSKRHRLYEIAGLCGLDILECDKAILGLYKKHLLFIEDREVIFGGAYMAYFVPRKIESRYKGRKKRVPTFLNNDISNIEALLRRRFNIERIVSNGNRYYASRRNATKA